MLPVLLVSCLAFFGDHSEDGSNWFYIQRTGSKYYNLYTQEVNQSQEVDMSQNRIIDLSKPAGEMQQEEQQVAIHLTEFGKPTSGIIKVSYTIRDSRVGNIFATATCRTRNGGNCGYERGVPLSPGEDHYLSWAPVSDFPVGFSHIEWELIYVTTDSLDTTLSVSLKTRTTTCKAGSVTCSSVCFAGECVVNHGSLMVAPCYCGANNEEVVVHKTEPEGDEKVFVIVASIITICILCICFVLYWRHVKLRAREQEESHSDIESSPEYSGRYCQTQAEAEAAADSLMVHFDKCTPNQTVSCCVCLEGSDDGDNSPDGSSDDWMITPCSHSMHTDCLRLWLVQRLIKMQSVSCPVCRAALGDVVNIKLDNIEGGEEKDANDRHDSAQEAEESV